MRAWKTTCRRGGTLHAIARPVAKYGKVRHGRPRRHSAEGDGLEGGRRRILRGVPRQHHAPQVHADVVHIGHSRDEQCRPRARPFDQRLTATAKRDACQSTNRLSRF